MIKKFLAGITIVATVSIVAVVVAVVVPQRTVAPQPGYGPRVQPAAFSTNITNPYFSLPVGRKLVYEGNAKGGRERIEILITGETKQIMGVETLVYWDRVYLNGSLIEETKDYLAQDAEGNVWYFGEDVNDYQNGRIVGHSGAWIAGRDGARPGIWVKANPQVGDSYRQEYYRGVAEDMADVVSVNETVEVPYGTFTNCLKTFDWTPLNPNSKAHKYYCPQVGNTVVEEDLATGEKVELIDVRTGQSA